ncbi:hypothetical protein V2I01_26435 [Micromonospora sp. BRA006-A]|nr:hypothetical protein [Micromonospora sp. BRA006-A]
MSASPRRDDAAKIPHELWQQAVRIRQEWLGHALSTQPADRQTAERCLTAVYARASRTRPGSNGSTRRPRHSLVSGWPTLDRLHERIRAVRPPRTPLVASDIAMVVSQLRGAQRGRRAHRSRADASAPGKAKEPWPELAPQRAFDGGVPLAVVLHQGYARRCTAASRTGSPAGAPALAGDGPVPVCWYGQQDASWIAYYDVLRRLGLARYGRRMPGTWTPGPTWLAPAAGGGRARMSASWWTGHR